MNKVGVFNVAVAVLIQKGEKILITKRASTREHEPNEWEPGITGRVDQHESCEEAALRETKEELSINIELIAPYNTFHFYRGKEKAEHLGVSFWAVYKSGEIVLDTTEQSEYKWVSPEEAMTYLTNSNVIEDVKKFIAFKKSYTLQRILDKPE
jgi:NADH pyrophosphatase NudC (nudix superfamily)